jgi:GT2 family glycosyltransferase
MPNEPVDVVAVVVVWNSTHHLRAAVPAIRAALEGVDSWRLVVVDNASSDGSAELARELAPEAVHVQTGRNAGYAAGLNAGFAAQPARVARLVLNPDVRLAPRSVMKMLAVFDDTRVGIAAPLQVDGEGRRLHSLRREPSVSRALGEAVLGGARSGRVSWLGEMVTDPAAYERPGSPDWASGSVLLVAESCARAVGAWDESYFLYSEETDFARRARAAGYTVGYVPQATATHIGGEAHTSPMLYSLLTVNRVRYFSRHRGWVVSRLFGLAVGLGELLRVRGRTHRAALRALCVPRARREVIAWRP